MTLIDPTDFIEAPKEATSLRFEDEKQQAKLELGICMAIYRWDELDTAVVNSWGGANSSDKRDWISGITIELFDERIVDVLLIEETLLYAMVDEFDTEVDNESALVIAALIVKIYREVAMKKYDLVDEMYAKWQEKQKSGIQKEQIKIGADPINPDVSDDDDDDDDDDSGDNEGAKVAQNDNSTLKSTSNANNDDDMELDEPQGPIIDDDGFELVQKRGRGKRH